MKIRVAIGVALAMAITASAQSMMDIDGHPHQPFVPAPGKLAALFFVTTDCPISNYYAAEIRRICTRNAGRLECYLIYTDPTLTAGEIRAHKLATAHGDYPAMQDPAHVLVKRIGATVTPEAALIHPSGELLYRGRIDDAYAALGKRRTVIAQHDLVDAIDAALAGKPIARARTQATGCSITPAELLRSILTPDAKPGPQ